MAEKKPKSVNFKIIERHEGEALPEPYKLLQEVRDLHHGETRGAKIALAWRLRQKEDVDGHLELGRCIKVSDLHKEFADFDFIITLNKEAWDDLRFTLEHKTALLDHECCHAAPVYDDETGEHKKDERGRLLFRTRKHDLAEFNCIVERHGLWKADLTAFAHALAESGKSSLFPPAEPQPPAKKRLTTAAVQ